MLQLLTLAVPAIVAAVTTWRWPTLRRRINDNLALLEKLPVELKAPIRQMLLVQLEHLAFEQQDWTENRVYQAVERFFMILWVVGIVGFVFLTITVDSLRQGLTVTQWFSRDAAGWTFYVGVILAPVLSAALAWSTWWIARRSSGLMRKLIFKRPPPPEDNQLTIPGT